MRSLLRNSRTSVPVGHVARRNAPDNGLRAFRTQAAAAGSGGRFTGPADSGESPQQQQQQPRLTPMRALTTKLDTSTSGGTVDVESLLETLNQYYGAEANAKEQLRGEAVQAAQVLKEIVSDAVNSKFAGLRGLQATLGSSRAVSALVAIAETGEPVAYEALQILCYRNTVACQQIIAKGVVDRIALDMPSAPTTLQCAMCYLLTALAAFSDESHAAITSAGLVPQLVSMCRPACRLRPSEDDTPEMLSQLENRSAAVLRNLAHNTKQHSILFQAGAVDALADIMRGAQDPKSRINAALAVACLVGHEENNPRLQLDEKLVESLLDVLESAIQGIMCYGTFWTVWKVCQGFANLTGNDKNKDLIAARGGVELMAEVLFGRHHNNEAAHRYALSAIWNLAFNDTSRDIILATPGLVDAIRSVMATTESPKTKEVAKGALWTLGLEQDVKSLTDNIGHHVHEDIREMVGEGGHIMLSYEWGQQQSVMLIKSELQKAGYETWMDVDKMSGSTLEAMAQAVEDSAVVLVCVSKKYKESQACRTEAEYAFQQRKKIVPLLMERDYKPSGWLGAIMGTRLYFDMSDPRRIPSKATSLFKELGTAGKIMSSSGSSGGGGSGADKRNMFEKQIMIGSDNPDGWSAAEVEEWLKRIKCPEYIQVFKEKEMDGMALSGLMRMAYDSRLTHEMLVAEFGIATFGQRLRFLEELHRLFA